MGMYKQALAYMHKKAEDEAFGPEDAQGRRINKYMPHINYRDSKQKRDRSKLYDKGNTSPAEWIHLTSFNLYPYNNRKRDLQLLTPEHIQTARFWQATNTANRILKAIPTDAANKENIKTKIIDDLIHAGEINEFNDINWNDPSIEQKEYQDITAPEKYHDAIKHYRNFMVKNKTKNSTITGQYTLIDLQNSGYITQINILSAQIQHLRDVLVLGLFILRMAQYYGIILWLGFTSRVSARCIVSLACGTIEPTGEGL